MRRLPGEGDRVALDAEGPQHHPERPVHRLQHRPLFDVQLEVGTGASELPL